MVSLEAVCSSLIFGWYWSLHGTYPILNIQSILYQINFFIYEEVIKIAVISFVMVQSTQLLLCVWCLFETDDIIRFEQVPHHDFYRLWAALSVLMFAKLLFYLYEHFKNIS